MSINNFPKDCTRYVLDDSKVLGESTVEKFLAELCDDKYVLSDFVSAKREVKDRSFNYYDSTCVIEILKNNPKYSDSRLPDILRYCLSPFEFKETVFERVFLNEIYDYQVVWENAEGYKVVFYVTEHMYPGDLVDKVDTEIFDNDPSVMAVVVQATDYENTYTVNDESESMLVSSVWFHVIQRDKTVWKVVAPVLQYFLNPELKLPVFNSSIKYVLQPVDQFKPGCPVPWREASINIEYDFREAVKILNIKDDVVADYILALGKENISSFLVQIKDSIENM